MQCRALTLEKRRCPAPRLPDAEYCETHHAALNDGTGMTGSSASTGRLGGWWGRMLNLSPSIPDGSRYDVPGWLKDAANGEVMEHLRGHPDSMVRWMAAFVLRKRRAPDAIDALWLALQSDAIRHVRQQSAVALGKIGTPAVVAPLVEGLNHDRDQGVRQACAVALGNLAFQRLPGALRQTVADEVARVLEREQNAFVKWDCIVALGQLGDRRLEKLLVRLQAEEIAQVIRDACRDSLFQIRQRDRAVAQSPN